MDTIKWTEHFRTGFDTIDEQHLHLVDLTNQLGAGVMENRLAFHDVQRLVKEFSDYARYHFDAEEKLMASKKIDSRYIRYHQSEHVEFLNYMTSFARSLSPDSSKSLMDLLSYLTRWLVIHILGTDKEYVIQAADISENRRSPEEAYRSLTKARYGAVDILLEALSDMVSQLSDRNLALTGLNFHLEEKVAQRTRALSDANRRLEEMALTDALTGLPNRRHAISTFNNLFARLNADRTPGSGLCWPGPISPGLSCMMIDADGFKQMNDSHGHDAGDIVLKELAGALRMGTRTDDFVSRLGGDEFLILCPDTGLDGALQVANALCKRVGEMRVKAAGGVWHGSISIGVATATTQTKNVEQLIKLADQSVYQAKRDGKGCVRFVQN